MSTQVENCDNGGHDLSCRIKARTDGDSDLIDKVYLHARFWRAGKK